jgi:hypothetical protein
MRGYPYIRRWGHMLSSLDYYIEDQITLARLTKAPRDATYRRGDGTWATVSELRERAKANPTAASTLDLLTREDRADA